MNSTYRYDSEWTKRLESMKHWDFYWHQQKLMEGLVDPARRESVLEIGVGTGFTANYCRSKGLQVTTLDIDKNKHPDIVLNIVDYDLPGTYDHVLAFEILEHIPFEEAVTVIDKLSKIASKYIFISVPTNKRIFMSLSFKIPKIPRVSIDWMRKIGRITTKNHHWELDYKDYTPGRLESIFNNNHLVIRKQLMYDYVTFYALEILNTSAQ